MSLPVESAPAPSLLPSQAAPAAPITPLDHRGWIYIANCLGMCLLILAFLLRIQIRVRAQAPLSGDDALIFASMVCVYDIPVSGPRSQPSHCQVVAVVQASVVFLQVSEGFGKSIDHIGESDLIKIQKV